MSTARGGAWRGPPLPDDERECWLQIINTLMLLGLLTDQYADLTDSPREGVVEAADFIGFALEWAMKGFAP